MRFLSKSEKGRYADKDDPYWKKKRREREKFYPKDQSFTPKTILRKKSEKSD